MARYKVLMTDSIFEDQEIERRLLKEIDAELILSPDTNVDTLASLAKDCDAIVATYAQVPKEVIDSCENCKVIIRTGIGYNNIDIKAATEKGIMVANVLNYCIEEVADHAIGLMLACLRKIVKYNNCVKAGYWDMNIGRPISRLSNLTLGLYGFGNIAREVAVRAKAFGMTVIAFDPYIGHQVFKDAGVHRKEDVDILIKECDVLSIHLPLNEQTEKVIDSNVFNKMKRSAYLINVSRGGLVNEEDLLKAIATKEISGCGIDVMQSEPGDIHSSLMTYDNVIVTPHAAFYSDESDIELRTIAIQQIVETFLDGHPRYWINMKEMERE